MDDTPPPLDLIIIGGFSLEEEQGLLLALTMVEDSLGTVDDEEQTQVHLHASKALRRCLDLPELNTPLFVGT